MSKLPKGLRGLPKGVRLHPKFINYGFTKDGRVWSRLSSKFLKLQKNTDGHYHITVCGRLQLIHRLVLESFVGECPQGMECRHLDGNPQNNNLSNLRWGTHSDNVRDAVKHNNHVNQKISNDTVRLIHKLWSTKKYSKAAIGRMFNISRGAVCDYINKKRRSWIC